jgi:ankyrin repeat protein
LEKKTKLVKQLLNCENVKFIKDFTGNTPLTHALAIKNYEIINLLLEFINNRPELTTIVDSKELT